MNKPFYEPAFPRDNPAPDGWSQFGMTLRDYFAAKAMQGFIANPSLCSGDNWPEDQKVAIEQAYEVADAMLVERDK